MSGEPIREDPLVEMTWNNRVQGALVSGDMWRPNDIIIVGFVDI